MRSFLAALMLLTRVPVPASAGAANPGGAAVFYPVVGGLIGAVVGAVAWGSLQLWPLLVAVTLAVAIEVVITGALHLDGLADCADSLGGRTREDKLRIMKDHATGVYGAAAVALVLLLKVTVIATFAAFLDGTSLVLILAAAFALSRAAMLPLARWLPYARAEGTGRAVVEGLSTAQVVTGLALAALVLVPVAWVAPWNGPAMVIVMVAAVALVSSGVGWAAKRGLGGVTGDVLGACAELTLLAGLLGAAAVLG